MRKLGDKGRIGKESQDDGGNDEGIKDKRHENDRKEGGHEIRRGSDDIGQEENERAAQDPNAQEHAFNLDDILDIDKEPEEASPGRKGGKKDRSPGTFK